MRDVYRIEKHNWGSLWRIAVRSIVCHVGLKDIGDLLQSTLSAVLGEHNFCNVVVTVTSEESDVGR